jgi:hypothetical protein
VFLRELIKGERMSVAVWYATSRPVAMEVGESLISEAQASSPLIWYEPIHLFVDTDYPAIVKGWSKCPPMSVQFDDGKVVEIAETDWYFMDYWDLRRILGELSSWSKKYDINWILTAEGQKMGMVKAGKLSWRLRKHLLWSARSGKATWNEEQDAARADELQRKYPFFQD